MIKFTAKVLSIQSVVNGFYEITILPEHSTAEFRLFTKSKAEADTFESLINDEYIELVLSPTDWVVHKAKMNKEFNDIFGE